jgi:acyl-coenzyme A synthetase/AMP-(fatty) acid ligase
MTPLNFVRSEIDDCSRVDPKLVAFRHEADQIEYSELHSRIVSLGQALKAAYGSEERRVLCIYLPKSLAQTILLAGMLYLEIPCLCLSAENPLSEVRRIFARYPMSGLIVTKSDLPRFKSSAEELLWASAIPLSLAKPNDAYLLLPNALPRAEQLDFHWLLHTSGSTGEAKAVMISQHNLQQRAVGEAELFNIQKQDRLLNLLPFTHDLGLNQLLTAILTHSTLELFTKITPLDIAKKIAQSPDYGITGMPSIWNSFLAIAEKHTLHIEHQHFITVSGGSMTEENLHKLRQVFHQARIIKTYGQTETFRSLFIDDAAQIRENSAGQTLKGVHVEIVNDSGQSALVGETGQLVHYGAGTMQGYWQDEALTSTKIKKNLLGETGILSGDYFKVLTEGKFQYVGRRDDLIKLRGRRFHLGEIEDSILRSGLVESVSVLLNDDLAAHRESLIAFVVPKSPVHNLHTRILNHCAIELPSFKMPLEFVQCSTLPLGSNLKVDRQKLLSTYRLNKQEDRDALC